MRKRSFNFVNVIFTRKRAVTHNIRFGRFSDRNKTNEQLFALSEADKCFKNKDYLLGVSKFFEFLSNSKTENIHLEKSKTKIDFSFYQGSKIINGFVNNHELFASSKLIKINGNNSDLFRTLLNLNYKLKFSKFSVKNNNVYVELNQSIENSTPESLYYSLRELSTIADRYDDYLEMNFDEVEIVNKSHIIELKENEFEVKLNFFRKLLKDTFEQVDALDKAKFTGARAFLLMNSIFKILYLISPEGSLFEKLKSIDDYYFTDNNKTEVEKIAFIYTQLKQISKMTDQELRNSFYYVTYTFPDVLPTDSDVLIEFIKTEIEKIYWYESNEYKNIANTILEYIIGYSCFHFGTLPVVNELFTVFWEIMNKEFYENLSIKGLPFEKNKISFFFLSQRINSINSVASSIFPKFFFNIKHLNLDNNFEFAKSFMHEIINLNFSQTKDNVKL